MSTTTTTAPAAQNFKAAATSSGTPPQASSTPLSIYDQYRQDLPDYADGFRNRRQEWDNIINRTKTAIEAHENEAKDASANLAVSKRTESASNKAEKIIAKEFSARQDLGKFDAAGTYIAKLYQQQASLQAAVNNPYSATSFTGNFATHKRGGLFWPYKNPLDKAADYMREGDHEDAAKHLRNAGKWWRNPIANSIRIIRMGFGGYRDWKNDLALAAKAIPAHRKSYLGLKATNKDVDYHEEKTAETLHKLLKSKDVAQMLRLRPDPTPATDPALAILIRTAKEPRNWWERLTNTGYPSVSDLKKQIHEHAENRMIKNPVATGGYATPQALRAAVSLIHDKAKTDIVHYRTEKKSQEKQIDVAKDFLKSCKKTKVLETQVSYIVGGMSRNATDYISAAASAGQNADDKTVARAHNMAKLKSARWTAITDAQDQCSKIEQRSFNPSDLGRSPYNQYLRNSAGASKDRGLDFLYTYSGLKALRNTFATASAPPAAPTPTPQPSTALAKTFATSKSSSGGGQAPAKPATGNTPPPLPANPGAPVRKAP